LFVFTMLHIIREQLPSGLSLWEPSVYADESKKYMQVIDYPNLQKPEIHVPHTFVKPSTSPKHEIHTEHIRKASVRRVQIWEPILRCIDDMYDMYSPSMKKCAKEMFIEKTKEFITCGEGSQYLGPKKCRDIMSCITNNKGWCESFWWYISYILDVQVCVHSLHTNEVHVIESKKNASNQQLDVYL